MDGMRRFSNTGETVPMPKSQKIAIAILGIFAALVIGFVVCDYALGWGILEGLL